MAKQSQLTLPLLEVLAAAGESIPCAEVYARVAARVGASEEEQARTVKVGPTHEVRTFDRDVRWARQRAKLQGLVESESRGRWVITGKGKSALRNAAPGIVITFFETALGTALWASCEDAVAAIEPGSVQLLLTSPPYPILRAKQYGGMASKEYVDWMTKLAEAWRPLLSPDGSLVLNLGDAWEKGRPSLDLYAERLLLRLVDDLGFRLCQRFEWLNPSKMPAPAEWVTVRRVRVKPSLERIYWLSLSDAPYADNRNVLVPYSDSMRTRLGKGGESGAVRPSGYALAAGAFGRDNGGAIPSNLITAANTESGSDYLRACRDKGLPVHPARFPEALPSFVVELLTRRHDVVYDPFGGSGTTAKVCERLERRWITSERCLEYVAGADLRLKGAAGYRSLCAA